VPVLRLDETFESSGYMPRVATGPRVEVDGPTTAGSRSYSSSWAVDPMMFAAWLTLWTPASWIEI
jgi:hypothetical protein